MTPCGHTTTTLRHHWACARYAGHPQGQHRYQRAEPSSNHYLLFNDAREVTGCGCGQPAHPDDMGYGNSIVDHLLEQGTQA